MALFGGLRHLHLIVSDVERSARFYETAFGMRRLGAKAPGERVVLASRGLRDQLSLSRGRAGGEVDHYEARAGAPGGVDHFGFVVSPFGNFERAIKRVVAAGGRFIERADLGPFAPNAYLRDPDGYILQIYRFPSAAGVLAPLFELLRRLGLAPA